MNGFNMGFSEGFRKVSLWRLGCFNFLVWQNMDTYIIRILVSINNVKYICIFTHVEAFTKAYQNELTMDT